MVATGMVQAEPKSGMSYVVSPPAAGAYGKQAKPGSLYVEFDVPAGSVRMTNRQLGWAAIDGPNSNWAKMLAKRKGVPLPQLPPAANIRLVMTK